MDTTTAAQLRPPAAPAEAGRVRRLLLLSGTFLLIQVARTDYGESAAGGAAALWFVVGTALLWLVHRRRSRVARGLVIIGGLMGAVVYAIAATESLHAALLAVAFLGQAVPLLSGPVRRHVRTSP